MIDTLQYKDRAIHLSRRINSVLEQRHLLPVVNQCQVTQSPDTGNVWLIAHVDVAAAGRLEGYDSETTEHQISTVLRKPVVRSNSQGLRYMVLLSEPKQIPRSVMYPDELPRGEAFPIGVTARGSIEMRWERIINLIVAGSQGSGKSNFLAGLAYAGYHNGYILKLVDPDSNTFNPDIWNRVTDPVASSPAEFEEHLDACLQEIERRSAQFRQIIPTPENIDEYNRRCGAGQRLPRVLLIADEANSYFGHKGIVAKLADLARRGRKWGIHITLAGHNWRASDVPRELSAMFPTRVCFRVADDTSGKVVLNNRTWGQKAQHISDQVPGRGILEFSGNCRSFQAYRLERSRFNFANEIPQALALSELETNLVRYAVEYLNGQFKVNQLAEAFRERGVSNRKVQELAKNWERCGWLSAPAHATDSRRVTDELINIAHISSRIPV